MAIVIDEMIANIEAAPAHEGGGEGEPHLADERQQAMVDLLELTQERKARLVVD